MEHSEAQSLYPAYNNGSLSREQVRDFHAHLKTCEDCRSRIRVQGAAARSKVSKAKDLSLASPETQAQMAKNRDLLIKVLALMALGWLVWRLKR